MHRFATRFRYGSWDGSQQAPLSADDVLGAIAEDLMEYGDLKWAMRNLLSRGMTMPDGGYIHGLRDMLKQLREQKRERLQQFDLSSVMQDIEQKLAEILSMEQNTIDEWLDQDSETFANDVLRKIAERSQETLDELPDDSAGRMKTLEKYEFLNPDAQRKYLDLLNELRKAMTQTLFKNVENMVKNLSDGDITRLKDMVQAMNEMFVKKIAGEDPGFEDFMDKFGDMFGDTPPKTLDELLEQMRRQIAASQSLMNSLTPDQQQQLQSLMSDRLGDPQLESALRKLAQEMDFLDPQGSRYRFDGKEQVDLEAAMELMDEMHQIDDLIAQVQAAERGGDPDHIDSDLVQSLLGDEAVESIDDLKKLLDTLEEAGYVRPTGDDKWELTPRGSRMIGQRALGEIYARLRRQSLGNHAIPEEGRFGERLEQTKAHEFGDPFHLHLPRTIRNAIDRDGPHTPVRLRHQDFEIYRSEQVTSTATAMLVDLSWSMALRGSFQSAKKVALALHNLITSQYPRDSFYIIGFAAYARELKAHDLPFLQWDEYLLGTNMQHALLLAERLLAKHDASTKQVIMISDGEPTAHLEKGQAQFAYPPTAATIRETYKAVKRCTQKGIAINTFMLDANQYLKEFMDDIARINGGRVFYTSPEKLGEYILVDYVQHKRKKLGGR
ncbi:MAG TPA: VWA domain-containing protein [Gammaproteobacteria bacterium]|nr:VWA domain-containing protein [Gammaproteobacteria bacterium]